MPADDARSVQAAYASAMDALAAGREEDALRGFGAIVERHPRLAEPHFQIARIFLRAGRADRAIVHAAAAARLKPGEADTWTLWAEAVATLSDTGAEADFAAALASADLPPARRAALAGAVRRRPGLALPRSALPAKAVRAVADALAAGEAEAAERGARALLARHPTAALAHDLLARARLARGDAAGAEAAAREAVARAPAWPEAQVTRARALHAAGRPAEALRAASAALRAGPGHAGALHLRGLAHADLGRAGEAVADWRRALDADPGHAEARLALARHLHDEEKDHAAALALLSGGLARGLDGPAVRHLRGAVFAELGRPEAALAEFERLRAMEPGAVRGTARAAELLQTLGRFDEAEAAFRDAIARFPDRGETYRVFLTTKRIGLEDPLTAEMERRFADPALPAEDRAHLGFALAKVMEDNGAYDRVFAFLRPANRLMRALRPDDSDRRARLVADLLASFRETDWSDRAYLSDNDFAPIFVTGMPRSGTTLVEQILASHSAVTGTGEIGVAPRLVLRMLGGETAQVRSCARIPPADYARVGAAYADYMRRHFPGAARPVDKTIQTSQYIGLLKRALPRARFVVVRRDPRDTLLSIYKNVFPDKAHRYAYDFGDLAAQYRHFTAFLDFWREVAPDWFVEVEYEALVADPGTQARRLVEACGLPWEEGCLAFHESDRRVKTLSLYQVRQPLYTSSTRAWERYGADLDEMMEALGPDAR